jgi:alpha-galactosidase
MTARFGFDLDLAGLTDHERTVCRRAVELYRDIRPLVQQGDLWRLVPPGERAALAFVSGDGGRAVLFAFQLTTSTSDPGPLRPGGLDPDRIYEVVALDLAEGPGPGPTRTGVERRAGSALMEEGLAWPLSLPCTARIWLLRSV